MAGSFHYISEIVTWTELECLGDGGEVPKLALCCNYVFYIIG